ncbi:hypothetical protein HWV62_32557 [Athelia sp. TMB]|nr:hypothetical protein HWV62_32557 [Athelia sp. TMB]
MSRQRMPPLNTPDAQPATLFDDLIRFNLAVDRIAASSKALSKRIWRRFKRAITGRDAARPRPHAQNARR